MREELNQLRSVERPAIIQAIAVAREHGDLSENAEYHAARERQSFVEGRVKELENKLARAEVIDPSKLSGDRVAFGATVKLSNIDSGEEVSYRILGADEVPEEVEESLRRSLPIRARAETVTWLEEGRDGRWAERRRFALGC